MYLYIYIYNINVHANPDASIFSLQGSHTWNSIEVEFHFEQCNETLRDVGARKKEHYFDLNWISLLFDPQKVPTIDIKRIRGWRTWEGYLSWEARIARYWLGWETDKEHAKHVRRCLTLGLLFAWDVMQVVAISSLWFCLIWINVWVWTTYTTWETSRFCITLCFSQLSPSDDTCTKCQCKMHSNYITGLM